ncbi:hypothetical protein WBQ96_28200 [Mesorhizobium sp. CCNWLY176]
MARSLKHFIATENIIHFEERLKTATSDAERSLLKNLLSQEKAQLQNPLNQAYADDNPSDDDGMS